MRSLYVRILAGSLGVLVLSLTAFALLFTSVSAPKISTLFRRFQAMQAEDAVAALARGGTPAVSEYFERLHRTIGFDYYLLDARGRDVVTGDDRSALLERNRLGPLQTSDRLALPERSLDGRFTLVALAPPPFGFEDFAPYYAVILLAVALLCWWLAVGIASPIRELTTAVSRFGRGDLSARTEYTRMDEIGDLARAFNAMAKRIETLVTAERRLLQDVSHELRSPLARLSVIVELLGSTTERRDRRVATLRREVDRMAALVGELIEVTRLEGDPSIRTSDEIDFGALVSEVVNSCSLEADPRGCTISLEGHTNRMVLGDPELLWRAVDNVLRNAIRYSPRDATVSVRIEDSEDETTVIVRDTGPGVPPDTLVRLTEPFFRVDPARDANTGGVGLGLAIAMRAIHLHRGQLSLENAHPGLRVRLTLPGMTARATA